VRFAPTLLVPRFRAPLDDFNAGVALGFGHRAAEGDAFLHHKVIVVISDCVNSAPAAIKVAIRVFISHHTARDRGYARKRFALTKLFAAL